MIAFQPVLIAARRLRPTTGAFSRAHYVLATDRIGNGERSVVAPTTSNVANCSRRLRSPTGSASRAQLTFEI